jgi:hypothetical protein
MKPAVTRIAIFAALTYFSALLAAETTNPYAPEGFAADESARRVLPCEIRLNEVAYSRLVRWSAGSVTKQGHLDRPLLLFDDQGVLTHLLAATVNVPFGNWRQLKSTCVMVIPLYGTASKGSS